MALYLYNVQFYRIMARRARHTRVRTRQSFVPQTPSIPTMASHTGTMPPCKLKYLFCLTFAFLNFFSSPNLCNFSHRLFTVLHCISPRFITICHLTFSLALFPSLLCTYSAPRNIWSSCTVLSRSVDILIVHNLFHVTFQTKAVMNLF